VGRPEERVPERVWWLGERRADRRRDVYLVAGLGLHAESIADDTIDGVQGLAPIALVPWGTAPELAAEVVPLHDLLTIGPTGVRVDRERFDARLRPARPKKEAVRPFPLPAGAVWERLVVEVVDDQHAVLRYGEREERRSYVELGFRDGRSKDTAPRPSELWTYFLALAREDGRLTWRTPVATPMLRDRVRELRAKLSASVPDRHRRADRGLHRAQGVRDDVHPAPACVVAQRRRLGRAGTGRTGSSWWVSPVGLASARSASVTRSNTPTASYSRYRIRPPTCFSTPAVTN
jgi:hypothetical protein